MLYHRYSRGLGRRHALASRKKATAALVAAQPVSTPNQKELLASEAIPLSKPSNHREQPFAPSPSAASPWRALFLAFFAIMQPEATAKETLEPELEFMEDLRVLSVPPLVSDVVDASELFWRCDLDSYAANNHNEDRSHYVLERLLVPTENPARDEASVFFCGCYDGHGGEQAVEFVQRNLYRNIKRQLTRGEPVADAIVAGFTETDQQFHRRSLVEFEKGCWSASAVGACAVIALVVDKKLFVASCGDCRAILAFRNADGSLSVEQVTWDHSANDEREQERLRILHPEEYDVVREIGAQNFYVKGRLQPTRSLGDTYMKVQEVNRAPMPRGLRIHGSFKRPYISAVPDVFEFDLEDRQPEFLVLGSDGLYGEMTNEEIANEIDALRERGVENVSQALRETILERIAKYYGISVSELEQIAPGERRNYHDDITIDVVHFTAPSCVAEHIDVAHAA